MIEYIGQLMLKQKRIPQYWKNNLLWYWWEKMHPIEDEM